ncbi:Thioredoxin domain-containing protein [Bordetella sputigena]|uniref:SCO family protein n=1 Tax=Bordetella sputigena TaxID=1416810 RepID=UPI0039EFB04C
MRPAARPAIGAGPFLAVFLARFMAGFVAGFLALCLARPAAAEPPPDAAALAFRQHPGRAIPPVRGLRDQDGREVTLADYLGNRPVIFVLGYYHCAVLCSTLMDAVLERVRGVGVPFEVVSVSIDPAETPADAARKYAYYRGLMDAGAASESTPGLHLLTAAPQAIAALTDAVGFPYRRDADTGQFYHPAGFVILTPAGRIARYFLGLGFTARDVRLALVEAAGGKVGGLADQLVLLCSHYDPATGRYSVAAMALARAAGLGALAALLAAFVCMRRRNPGRPRA